MKKKRIVTGVAASVVALSLALTGCSSSGSSGDKSGGQAVKGDPKAIIKTNDSEPESGLIPGDTNETGGGKVVDVLWEGLVYYDKDGKTHNGVAQSITSQDQKVWTIKIHKDRKFSDGTPVKAENFVKAWQATTKNAMKNSWWFTNFEGVNEEGTGDLSGVKVVDDTTFTVTLKAPQADFPLTLGYAVFYPLPDSAFDGDKVKQDFGRNPVGNGSYKFEKWESNKIIKTVANDKYVGDRKPKNGGIDFVIYQQDNAAYADLQAGNLDVMQGIPSSELASYQNTLGERAINQEQAVWQSFTISSKEKHFETNSEEGRLRRHAISMAIDRKLISDKIFHGGVKPAKAWLNKTISYYKEGLKGSQYVEFNPKEAKKLWKKAESISHYDGDITIAYNADASHKEWVDAVCHSIQQNLGVKAHGNGVPTFKDFRTQINDRKMKGGFRTGWQADYPGPVNYFGAIYKTGASSNDGDYSNKDFDATLNKLIVTKDKKEGQDLTNKLSEILFEDMPAIPLWTSSATGGYSEKVSNVVFDWHGVPIFDQIVKQS